MADDRRFIRVDLPGPALDDLDVSDIHGFLGELQLEQYKIFTEMLGQG